DRRERGRGAVLRARPGADDLRRTVHRGGSLGSPMAPTRSQAPRKERIQAYFFRSSTSPLPDRIVRRRPPRPIVARTCWGSIRPRSVIGKSLYSFPDPVDASSSPAKSAGTVTVIRPFPLESSMSSVTSAMASIVTSTSPLPLDAFTGPRVVATVTRPLPLDAFTGPPALSTLTSPLPLEALTGPPALTRTLPLPLPARTSAVAPLT